MTRFYKRTEIEEGSRNHMNVLNRMFLVTAVLVLQFFQIIQGLLSSVALT